MAVLNNTSYPSGDEVTRVDGLYNKSRQEAIKSDSKVLIETLKAKLKGPIGDTLRALHHLDKPVEHEQLFLTLFTGRMSTFIGDHIQLQSFQKFIDDLQIEIP